MAQKIQAGIFGGAGFTGGEMVRLLLNHPQVDIAFVHSRSHGGDPLHSVHTDLLGETELAFTSDYTVEADVWLLCLGPGESRKLMGELEIPSRTKIIDLSQDFRLGEQIKGRHFIYGLPEWQREKIRRADHIANPGCFATAVELGLLPLASEGLLKEVHTTGITGSTGAGQKVQDTTQFSWRANNVNSYKALNHQHLAEILQTLGSLQPGFQGPLNFIPWRGGFTRGIFVTSYLDCVLDLQEAYALYKSYYASHPFTKLSDRMVDVKQVVNTNKVLIHLEKAGGKLVIHSVEDNLIKGACGQALQNLNLMFGLEETAGLKLKSIAF